MSLRSVFQTLRMEEGHIPRIRGFTVESMKRVYAGQLRRTLAQLGYGDLPVLLTDPAVLTALDTFAHEEIAQNIIRVYNERLWNAMQALPKGLSDEQIRAGLAEFHAQTADYNRQVLVPYTSAWTRQQAMNDAVTRNGLEDAVHWIIVGGPALTPDVCEVAIAASPMDSETAAGYDFPAHRRCPHLKVPVLSENAHLPASWDVWRGGDEAGLSQAG